MKTKNPVPIYLKDYQPLHYQIVEAFLEFDIEDVKTSVTSKLTFMKKGVHEASIELHGEKLELEWVKLNHILLQPHEYKVQEKKITIFHSPNDGVIETKVYINPIENTELEGLYKSGEIFCTQNEPEGFRKITYFLDRPDNMTRFTTKVIADKKKYPVLLSNGNCIEKGDLANGRHYAVWNDPFAKPSYLFALVAGHLAWIHDSFTTKSGRVIDLYIYTEKGDETRCFFAMESLKKAMKWDEDVFGLEYDLDIYMIVAVHSYNMGAMENKGLNIFNTSCVLADDRSATDDNYLRVETVIAHEYFHNWTGNRVTVRDWFQLTLKEGLTVFRDQEFSSDMHSRAVKRIEDVLDLKERQFPEDAGPNAHPIQPDSYIEMNNFYTPTVYDKGAEVIRMIHTLLGKQGFRKGIDKYFELFDGQAVTTEDFIKSMEIANDADLSQFRNWYKQVGTPEVVVNYEYDPKSYIFKLYLTQSCPKSKKSEPLHFPFKISLIGADGREVLSEQLLEIRQKEQEFVFENIETMPLPSLNRNFSAPVNIEAPYHLDDLIFLMRHDNDLFNRFDRAQEVMTKLVLHNVSELNAGNDLEIHRGFLDAFREVLLDRSLDGMFLNKALTFPHENFISDQMVEIDVDSLHEAREFYLRQMAYALGDDFLKIYEETSRQNKTIQSRKLQSLCLKYLTYLEEPSIAQMMLTQYTKATNMTEQMSAMSCLCQIASPESEEVLDHFYKKWHKDPLVMMKWFAVQAASKLPGTLDRVKVLMNNPSFDVKIPNLVRSLQGTFIENMSQFHAIDGSGYEFIADQIIELDGINPHLSSRFVKGFNKLDKFDSQRKRLMKQALKRIMDKQDLSSNVYEIASNILEK